MQDDTALQAIEKLAQIIGQSGNSIVHEYAYWFIWASIAWIGFGISMIVAACKLPSPEDWNSGSVRIARLFFAFMGAFIITANFGDLFAPQGIAIHQLIRDVRGS